MHTDKEAARRAAYLQEIGNLSESLGAAELSTVERKVVAEREKQKGNECFRTGENEQAYMYYSKSLAFDPANAIVYANRAMACIRLEK